MGENRSKIETTQDYIRTTYISNIYIFLKAISNCILENLDIIKMAQKIGTYFKTFILTLCIIFILIKPNKTYGKFFVEFKIRTLVSFSESFKKHYFHQ